MIGLSLKDIYTTYIPSDRECVVILALYQKTIDKTIEPYFTQETFRDVAAEVLGSEQVKSEEILRKLLDQFLEVSHKRHSHKRYTLTSYANRFAELVFNQINNSRNRYSLSESFYQFAQLDVNSMSNADDLELWYQLSFSDSATRTIDDHIGGLNAQLKDHLKQLSNILKDGHQTIGGKIGSFADVFHNFSTKAFDVQQTLQLRYDLNVQLSNFVDKLHGHLEEVEPNDTDETESKYGDYKKAKAVEEKVRHYFNQVEDRVSLIIDKIRFAEERLTELQSTFREHARFRTNLKRLLSDFLSVSEYDKVHGTRFKLNIPLKALVADQSRFIKINKYDFGLKIQRSAFVPSRDRGYFSEQQSEISRNLKRQEVTAKRVDKLITMLNQNGSLDVSEQFWEMYEHDKDLESAVKVCFTLLNIVSSRSDFVISIDQTPQVAKDNSITIWQMNITKA